jgi:hypothetical protein
MLLRLRRPLRLLWGYIAACLLMGFFLACATAWTMPGIGMPEVFVMTTYFCKVAVIISLLPSLVVIAVFEWRSVRRWTGYAIFGALLSAIAAVFISGGMDHPQAGNLVTVIVCFAILGAACASIYWWIAGRFAGHGAVAN